MTSADSPLADSDVNLSDADDNSIDLFWKGVVKPEEPLVVSGMEGYFLRVTNASLGPDVQTNTRSCLTVVQASDEESEKPGIICTLKNDYENHPLNLLVTDDIQFSLSGTNKSPVHLVGYFSPMEEHVTGSPFDMGDDLEDIGDDDLTEEELAEMDDQTKHKLLQNMMGRKRKLAEMEKDIESRLAENEKEPITSAKKKQKTLDGKAKSTLQNSSPNENKNKPNPNKNTNTNANANTNQNKNKNKKNKNKNNNNKPTNEKSTENSALESPTTHNTTAKSIEVSTTPENVMTESVTNTPEVESPKEVVKDNLDDKEKPWKHGPQGLKFKDIRAGDGKPVKKGSKVRVYYVGQLPNKKVFDKSIDGPGFEFKLGAGDVIQGWEKGLFGMKVGGKRRLVVPPKLAYGTEGSLPDVPPNSELTFTIEVKSVD